MEKPMLLRKPIKWRGRGLKRGAIVHANERERSQLLRLGWAVDHEQKIAAPADPVEKPKRTYKRKDVAEAPAKVVMTPEPPHVAPPASKAATAWDFHWPKAKAEDDGKA
jgi:hypothetical protein